MGTGRLIRFREEIFMRRGRVWYTAAITLVMMTGLFTITSFAAKGEKITAIKLEVKDNLQLGSALDEEDELEIETSADSYGVAEWESDNEGFTWNSEHKPRVKVTVTADDDYYFSVSKDKVKIKGDAAKVVSTKKEDSQTLIITLDLKPMAERVGPIEYAYLNGTVATWAPAQGAVAYELYLYRDSKAVGSKRTTTETTYDFGTAIRKDGEYYYKVRAVGAEGSKEGKYTESASRYVSPSEAQALASAGNSKAADGNNANTPGQWVQDETGWRWLNPDGSYTVNNWAFINNKWYYFGENSYMATGWIQWKELWYYLGPDGDMQTNFQTPDGHMVNGDGVCIW